MSERLPEHTDDEDSLRLSEFINGGLTRDQENVIFYHPDGDIRIAPAEGGVFDRWIQESKAQ